ncbi:MBL fold metallo-hydrolase [Paenibacillus sp. GCM10012307]|uniref:MBL fold metallo-hydrolase n=1 Tax=Paenibacillus roseus TaxID=2798579 RepID=A0A934J7V2_9BACL|nr:MBL fold metallo-hydrolase [Paenibacillus roseus]MBJ6362017.1 MBL fold metallo-hydrolase [Paenibacillus roseus]
MKSEAFAVKSVEWGEGWIQVKVPLPFSLRWVNSYLIPEINGGYALIDPGLHTAEAKSVWEWAFARYGISTTDVKRIVLTHQHPDHYGLAGWFQERSGAPVLMSALSHEYAVRMWGEDKSMSQAWVRLFARHGLPGDLLTQLEPHLESFVSQVSPQPEVTYLPLEGTISLGGREWEIVHTPGHASGHLCFYNRELRYMLCGDQVLPDITPNVSVIPGDPDRNPLLSFLNSLKRLSRYEVEMAFPGHRNPFPNFAERLMDLNGHHVGRLAELEGWLEQPQQAYALCARMFGKRTQNNIHQLRFAMSETLAHLFYLEEAGRIKSVEHASGILYHRTGGPHSV